MVANPRSPVKSRTTPKSAPISLKEELEAEETGAEATAELAAAPAAIEEAAKPVVLETAVSVSVLVPVAPEPAAAVSTLFELDPGEWPLKTLDAFSENAAAVFDFAFALGRAKSVSDAIELQSRFASERYAILLRQSNEFFDLARKAALEPGAPLRLSFSTF